MKWTDMTIGRKIGFGFALILLFLFVIVFLSYRGVGGIVTNAEQVIEGNKLDGLLVQKEVDHLNWASALNALLTDKKVTTLGVETDDHKCGFGKWLYGEERARMETLIPELARLFQEIEAPHHRLHATAIEIGSVFKQANPRLPILMMERKIDHLNWANDIRDALLRKSERLDVQTDPTKCKLGRWLQSPEAKEIFSTGDDQFKKIWNEMVAVHETLHESATLIQQSIAAEPNVALQNFQNKTRPMLDNTLSLLNQLQQVAENNMQGMEKANQIYAEQTVPNLVDVQAKLKKIRAVAKNYIMTDEAMLAAAKSTRLYVTVVGFVSLVAGAVIAFFLAGGITTLLRRVSGQMDEGASQVASASSQVASTSQSLAEGASEQAASIEETSSSLEEMASMTRRNADSAGQADELMKEANTIVNQTNASMEQLTLSMKDISAAGEETQKIVKTIDEIAFQTNLLALNAAVEAARAGEAGAGFAVVADEVRNLALRAAEAAKNTAAMIEGIIQKIGSGSVVVGQTNDAFGRLSQSTEKVARLVAEISAASDEQAQGIEQVNQSVSQMDKITQQNAANAEESASASEEMSAQAEQMRELVIYLRKMVDGENAIHASHRMPKLMDRRLHKQLHDPS